MAAACQRGSETKRGRRLEEDGRSRGRLVCRSRRRDRPRLRPLQRDVRRALLRGAHGARRRAVRLRQRRRSRRVLAAGTDAGHGQDAEPGAVSAEGPAAASKGRLFRNDLQINADGTRTLHFTDVTDQSGINANGYGMGAATGDYNNDGCVDLYVTTLGRNQLFRNNCDGTFTDVSKASRTDDDRLEHVGGVRRLRPRRLARSVRRPLSELHDGREQSTATA